MFNRQGSRKYLNEAERKAYMRAAQADPNRLRRAFGLTLYYTGCRISEALNLTLDRLDDAGKCLIFETLKRRKRGVFRAVPVPDQLMDLLGEIRADLEPAERLWPFSRATAYRTVKEHFAQAAIAGAMASPKGLRHGFAVACLGGSVPLPVVKKWLGHARLETTAIYLDVSGDEERELAERLWRD